MIGTEQERGRVELVSALSTRFVELRRRAGLTQQGVAGAMGKSRAGKMPAGRLEHGGVQSASVLTVAEYLRAVRAGPIPNSSSTATLRLLPRPSSV
jgi:hypothetical protein